jgi:3-hydroxybutyryl-CoA dehydratase
MMLPQMLIEKRFYVDRDAIQRYADITLDYNPLHLNAAFAAKTPHGGIIAHGMLSLSLIWQSLAATFGPQSPPAAALDIRFVHPVRENDWVISGGALSDRAGKYDVWVRAEGAGRSAPVIIGIATIGATAS